MYPHMKRAYLLVEVEPGKELEIIRELRKISEVTQIDFVHGEYDIVAAVTGEYKTIDRIVLKVRRLPHIRKTVTLTAFDIPLEELW